MTYNEKFAIKTAMISLAGCVRMGDEASSTFAKDAIKELAPLTEGWLPVGVSFDENAPDGVRVDPR